MTLVAVTVALVAVGVVEAEEGGSRRVVADDARSPRATAGIATFGAVILAGVVVTVAVDVRSPSATEASA